MAQDETFRAGPSKLVIRNIGLLLSGDLKQPILDADTVVASMAASPRSGMPGISISPGRQPSSTRQA